MPHGSSDFGGPFLTTYSDLNLRKYSYKLWTIYLTFWELSVKWRGRTRESLLLYLIFSQSSVMDVSSFTLDGNQSFFS